MNAAERSTVQWGRTVIQYGIQRSARRSTVSIAVDPEHGVLLTAPHRTSTDRLDRIVRDKALWIAQKLRGQGDLPSPLRAREFVTGETFLYLGRQYRLRVERGTKPGVRLRNGRMVVAATREGSAGVRKALIGWYRSHASEWLDAVVSVWAHRLRVEVSSVVVRDQKKRWASCDAQGNLRFNWRVMQAPRSCVEYVVAHELVHRIHRNHSRAFWTALGRVMPAYERRRETLRMLGPSLEW